MQADHRPSPQAWDRFVAVHPDGHLLQTSSWGDLKSAFGWHARRVAMHDEGRIVAGAQVLCRRLPMGLRIAYVPKGPLIGFDRPDLCRTLFAALREACRSERVFVLSIEPDLPQSAALSAQLSALGLRPSPHPVQPRRTILVDIRGTEQEILQRMKSKTRYNIRLASRKGVQVHQDQRDSIRAFNRLMAVTGERDEFGVHSATYYEQAYDILASADMASLFIATFEEQPVAGLIACACGHKAWYMYGASGNEHREMMPTYALQWAAIRWARSRGCTSYDLWGVPDCDQDTLETQFADRSDGLWGVYRNKRGYGGQVVRYAGAFDDVFSPPLYWIYRLGLKLRKW